MKEITCPQCGAVIKIDDSTFAELISHIKEETVNKEVERRLAEARERQAAEEAARAAKAETLHSEALSAKDREIEALKQQIAGWDEKLALGVKNAKLEAENAASAEMQKKEAELLKKGETINTLIAQAAKDKEVATERMQDLLEVHKKEVETLEKEVEMYKSFRAKRSVKLMGEDLEQHCYALYNQNILPLMPNATFEKDNTAVKEEGEEKGTKGDFIFRDKEDGQEYVSIMFEMKNESDVSANKKKNADHFDKLDKDRKKKGCEFAVLVSMLEMDNDLYNNGIVAVPGYDKMYVVRPDNFLPIITLLVQTSKKALGYKKELSLEKSRSVDVTNFENMLLEFQTGFSKNVIDAKNRYDEAIKGIDSTIDTLTKIKESLRLSTKHLTSADNKAQGLTVRKLTRGNETMKRAFEEARERSKEAGKEDEPDDQ